MSLSDFTSIATLVIAVCAFFSPVATTYLNNKHLEKMKRLEYEHADKLEREAHEREIYEGYIRAAGACVQAPRGDAERSKFGDHSALVAYYVPKNIRNDVLLLEKFMRSDAVNAGEARTEKLSEIVTKLRELRDTQKPQ